MQWDFAARGRMRKYPGSPARFPKGIDARSRSWDSRNCRDFRPSESGLLAAGRV